MLAPWKKSYDQPRQLIKKERHYFASKGPSSQSYGFSSSHIWMWVGLYRRLLLLLSRLSCLTRFDPLDGSLPGSPISGILQARTLEWVAISFSNAWKRKVKEVAQSCLTLCDSMDCSLPGSSVHGIFQARILEWGAIAEHQRIVAFELWCWRRLLRVPWTARRSNQSILKEISPEYSLEGLM